MELRLIGQAHSGAMEKGDGRDVRRIKSEFHRQRRLFLKALIFMGQGGFIGEFNRGMQITRNPAEFAGDFFRGHVLRDAVHGGEARVPDRLGMIAAESFHEVIEAQIGGAGEMCGGMAGIGLEASITLQQGDGAARAFEEIGGGDSRDAAPHDHHIHLMIFGQPGISGGGRGCQPE